MNYGDVAINFESFDKIQANLNDYKITVNISGQTLLEYDTDRSIIRKLFADCIGIINALKIDDIASLSNEQIVGLVQTNGIFNSDGEVNTFNLVYDLFVCDLQI